MANTKQSAALKTVADAAAVVARAAEVASDVSKRAAETAANVVDLANKTSEGYLLLAKDIAYIKESMEDMNKRLDSSFVTHDQFAPVRNVVYGMVSVMGLAVLGAVVKLVLIS